MIYRGHNCSDRMCGADDCLNCHPNYQPDEDEMESAEDALDREMAEAEDAWEKEQQDARDREREGKE